MKKNLIIATLVAVMTVMGTVASAASNYSDWFKLSRINATDCDTNLTREATREEVGLLVANLVNKLGLLPSKATLSFDDDDDFESSNSYKKIARLSSTGIVTGYPDDTFGPENDITRAEALTIILRTVDYLSLDTESYRRGNSFTDTEGHWAEAYCDRAYEQGLVSGRGNGRFYPDDEITREEVITILINLMGESNNTLIYSIDQVYDLEFENEYYDDEDDYDDYRYTDKDYEDLIERPTVNNNYTKYDDDDDDDNYTTNTGNNSRPVRPTVDLTENDGENTSNGNSRPTRPTVDLSSNSSNEDDSTTNSSSSSRPTRPTV